MSLTLKNIPKDWKLKKLRDVSDFSNGKGHEQVIDENGYYIVVNSKFISTDGLVKKFSNQDLCPLYEGELAMVMSDIPNGKAIAKCFIIDEDNKYTLNQRICSIKPNSSCDYKFLYYVVNRNRYFLAFDNGVSQTNLRKDEVLDCPIQLPPLPEQQKIAEILSTVDAKIEVIDQQIIETQELKKGLMQQLLTKGIGHTEFKDSPLGEIPREWDIKTLEGLKESNTSISYGVVQPGDEDINGVLFIRGGDIKNGKISNQLRTISKAVSDGYSRTLLKGGELLISLVGYPGECAVVPKELAGANIARQVGIIRLNGDNNKNYIQQYLSSPIGKKNLLGNLVGSAQQVINLNMLRKVRVPIAPLPEQQKISNILGSIDEKLEILEEKKTNYQELKQGLMQQLLTGKVRVKLNSAC